MSQVVVVLDQVSPLPAYEQICAQLRAYVVNGQLAPGVLLPSVRQLARDLGVAPNTIMRAYNQLEQEGWVRTENRRGVLVAEQSSTISAQQRGRQLTQLVSEFVLKTYRIGSSTQEVYAELERQLTLPLSEVQ